MRQRWVSSVGVLAVLCGGVVQGQQAAPNKAELAAITERGRELAAYDRAVWHATDAVQVANPKTAQGQQTVARLENGKWKVVYGALNADKTKFLISYEAVEGTKQQEFSVVAHETPVEDSGFYLFAARALEKAMADFGGGGRPYSSAVLGADDEPGRRSGKLYIYLYPAQTKAGVYPLGGDVRYLVSADGEKILEKRQLHNGIIEDGLTKGKKSGRGSHAHALSDVPEDTDVLHVLQQDPARPEVVGTAHFVYEIGVDGTIGVRAKK